MQTHDLKNTLVTHYAGSLSYGTNLPTSDVDIRGIFCAGREQVTTPFFPVREVTIPDEEDGKLYELSNFIKLYTDGNPNILETLWVDDNDILVRDEMYEYLRAHNRLLLSSKVAFTFSGYALSQLKRIKGHNKWINKPQPVEPPKHGDYLKLVHNFTSRKMFNRDFNMEELDRLNIMHYGGDIFGVLEKTGYSAIADNDFNISVKQVKHSWSTKEQPMYIIKYLPDEYKLAKENHTNYWTWKNNRNVKRSALEEDFGYDTKHAMHLVRLLRMAEETLTTQKVIVKRPDAQELLAIRAGKWTYNELLEYAEGKDDYIRGELYKNTDLPKKPNIKLASGILTDIQDYYWNK